MKSKVTNYRINCARQLSGKILDLGAGEGDYTKYLNGRAVSMDPDYKNLKEVRGDKIVGSAIDIPFRDDVFDGVWSCAVLEHVEINFIPEALRITKSGGTIFILTPNRNSPWDILKRMMGYGDWWSNEGHVRLYSAGELRKYGKVRGETWWAPGIDLLARLFPIIGHTLMLEIKVTAELKNKTKKLQWP